MNAMDVADDIDPDETMDLDGGRRVDLAHVPISIPVPLARDERARLEALAGARGETVRDTARSLIAEASKRR
jgi:hypothetical protein